MEGGAATRQQTGRVAREKLHTSRISWKRLEEFGLEYRFIAQYLQNKISYDEMQNSIQKESEDFARRQITWFKRDLRIHWITNYRQAEKLAIKFLHTHLN